MVSAQLAPSRFFQNPLAGSIWFKTRSDLYFADQHQNLKDSYLAATDAVRGSGCDEIGLDDTLELYEYPVIAMLGIEDGRRRVRLTGVYNSTVRYAVPQPPPCAVICFACARVPHKWAEYKSVGGRVTIFGNVAVFSSDGRVTNTEGSLSLPTEANERRRATIAGIDDSIKQLHQLRKHAFASASSTYRKAVARYPDLQAALSERFDDLEQPFYDGVRVAELTLELRADPGSTPSSKDLGPLIDAQEALKSFIADESRASSELIAPVGQASRNLRG